MSNAETSQVEKGDQVARVVWNWLVQQERMDLVPWGAEGLKAEQRGYRECLADLRQIMESESWRLQREESVRGGTNRPADLLSRGPGRAE